MRGFHLVELLIVLVIAGIMATSGFNLYQLYFTQERRLEAAHGLTRLAVAMEQYQIEHHSYQGATLDKLQLAEVIAKDHYRLGIHATDDNNYQLTATPLGNQAEQDKACATLTLNANGEKNITGTGTVSDCWSV